MIKKLLVCNNFGIDNPINDKKSNILIFSGNVICLESVDIVDQAIFVEYLFPMSFLATKTLNNNRLQMGFDGIKFVYDTWNENYKLKILNYTLFKDDLDLKWKNQLVQSQSYVKFDTEDFNEKDIVKEIINIFSDKKLVILNKLVNSSMEEESHFNLADAIVKHIKNKLIMDK